jgi:hypothetical protein
MAGGSQVGAARACAAAAGNPGGPATPRTANANRASAPPSPRTELERPGDIYVIFRRFSVGSARSASRRELPQSGPLARFGMIAAMFRPNFIAVCLDEAEDRTQQRGNLGNVGQDDPSWCASRVSTGLQA